MSASEEPGAAAVESARLIGAARLVGRRAELARLGALLGRAAGGTADLVLLAGEPGVGKTRLAAEAAEQARSRGFVVLHGGAQEGGGRSAFGPFTEAVRIFADGRGPETLARLAGSWRSTLADVLPELAGEPPEVTAWPLRPPEPATLLEAWAALFAALADECPAVLVVEDLQWATGASLDLLLYLRRRLRSCRILFIGTYRDDEVAIGGRLDEILEELARSRLALVIHLDRLDPSEADALVAALLDGPASPALLQRVHGDAEGLPFLVEEVLRELADAGRVARTGAIWDVRGVTPAGAPGPARGAVERRLRRLPASVQRVLGAAAVLGPRIVVADVAAVEGLGLAEVEDALAEASRRRLVRVDGDGALIFGHDRIREASDARMPAAERRLCHDRAAALATRSGAPASAAQAARHLLLGTRPERALSVLAVAASAATNSGAHRDAEQLGQAAAEVLRRTGDRHKLATTLVHVGEAQAAGGRFADALATLDEAIGLLRDERGGRWPERNRLLARALLQEGTVLVAREEPRPAQRGLEAALAASAAADAADQREAGAAGPRAAAPAPPGQADPTMSSRIRFELGRLAVTVTGELEEGDRLLRGVEEEAAARGDDRARAEALALRGQAAAHAGDFETGEQRFRGALAIAETIDDPSLAGLASDGLARLAHWTARFGELDRVARRELADAARTGNPQRLGWPRFWLGLAALGVGDWDAARTHAGILIELGTDLGARRFSGQGLELRGLASAWRGDFVPALADLGEAAEHLRAIGPGAVVYYLGPYALVLLAAGQPDAAAGALDELWVIAERYPPGESRRVQAANVVALGLLGLGDVQRATALRAELEPARDQFHWYPVARTLALLAAASGDLEQADADLRRAQDLVTRGAARPHLAAVLRARATLARLAGPPGASTALDRQADALVATLGIHPAMLGPQPGEPHSAAVPGGLSLREVEVLGHVAAGRTNREIANLLGITEKTATNHVTHILDKLGVENRAAAAAFAIRSGLA